MKRSAASSSGEAPRRRRGAPLGNANHLKHGFYSRLLCPWEKKILDQIPFTDLQGEIETLRAFLQRYGEIASRADPGDQESARRDRKSTRLNSSHDV